MIGHKSWCGYPSEPCSCELDQQYEATHHRSWCSFPKDFCDCGLYKRQDKFKETFGKDARKQK